MVAFLLALVAIFTFVTFSKIGSVCKRNIHDTPEDITTYNWCNPQNAFANLEGSAEVNGGEQRSTEINTNQQQESTQVNRSQQKLTEVKKNASPNLEGVNRSQQRSGEVNKSVTRNLKGVNKGQQRSTEVKTSHQQKSTEVNRGQQNSRSKSKTAG